MTNWRYEIKHGPDGEANYAWIYKGDLFVATMRTHHAVEIVKALSASPAGVVKPLKWNGWENEEKLTVEEAWQILVETPDITSPEEYPDHALITMEQLGGFMARARIMSAIEPAGVGVAPAGVYKIMKRYKDNGRFEWDFVSQMCRDIAALKGDEQ